MNPLTTARTMLATAVAAEQPLDVNVYDYVPDTVAAPAVMVVWSDPAAEAVTGCAYTCRLSMVCVVGRMDPTAQVTELEELIAGCLAAGQATGAAVTAGGVYPIEISGVTYLAAAVTATLEVV